MEVFVLGGTGSIGRAVVVELVKRSHQVIALSRSEQSDQKLRLLGATPVRGDLTVPADWADLAVTHKAVIQVAATFEDDMGDVDFQAMSALKQSAERLPEPIRLIYTGGCWLYGATGDGVATEDRPFNPLPSFAWMIQHAEMLLESPKLNTAVIHPAMVYNDTDGGVFDRYMASAKAGKAIEVWGSMKTRWPLIESADLARAYCDLLERPDLNGYFNAVAQQGVAAGDIVHAIASAYASDCEPIVVRAEDAVAENGAWAKGPTLDQQMSAKKLRAATGWVPQRTDYKGSL
ncbi:MAG: NAD-dependent epimerase/dehydratase family protein [Pseudomonadota bacterium]